jgi:hypothetical protein
MFDLEKAMADWRRQMVAAGLKKGEPLDELESHLRDDIQQQIQAGLTTPQAFEIAVERIGGAQALKSEFAKIGHTRMSFLAKLKGFLMGSRSIALPPLRAFTPNALQSLELARAEAPRLNHDFIGTEHVLLGLLNSPSDIVPKVMRRLGVQSDAVRSEITKLIGPGLPAVRATVSIPYTPRATRALALAVAEAEALHQSQISPEHIFLGLIKEGEGVAGIVLRSLGVDVKRTREEIINEMGLRKRAG